MGTEYTTNLEICGSKESIEAVMDFAQGERVFDLQAMKPQPQDLKGSNEIVKWRVENWGCWNNSFPHPETTAKVSIHPDPKYPSQLWYTVRTRNGAPVPIVELIAEKFPSVTIHNHYHDCLLDWDVHQFWKNGKLDYEYNTYSHGKIREPFVQTQESIDQCELEAREYLQRALDNPEVVGGRPTKYVKKLLDNLQFQHQNNFISDDVHKTLTSEAIIALENLRSDRSLSCGSPPIFQYLARRLMRHDSRYEDERDMLEAVRDSAKVLVESSEEVLSWYTNALPMELCGRVASNIFTSMVRLQELADHLDMDRCDPEQELPPHPCVLETQEK